MSNFKTERTEPPMMDCLNANDRIQIANEYVAEHYLEDVKNLITDNVIETMQEFRIPDADDYLAELEGGEAVADLTYDFGGLPELVELGRAYIKATRAMVKMRQNAGLSA